MNWSRQRIGFRKQAPDLLGLRDVTGDRQRPPPQAQMPDLSGRQEQAVVRASVARLEARGVSRSRALRRVARGNDTTVRYVRRVLGEAARAPADEVTSRQRDGLLVLISDITQRKRAEAELARLALHDALTGLPNRALLLDRIAGALTRRRRHGGGGPDRRVGELVLGLRRQEVADGVGWRFAQDRHRILGGEVTSNLIGLVRTASGGPAGSKVVTDGR